MLKEFSAVIEAENNKEPIWHLGKLLLFARKLIEIKGWVRPSAIDTLLR